MDHDGSDTLKFQRLFFEESEAPPKLRGLGSWKNLMELIIVFTKFYKGIMEFWDHNYGIVFWLLDIIVSALRGMYDSLLLITETSLCQVMILCILAGKRKNKRKESLLLQLPGLTPSVHLSVELGLFVVRLQTSEPPTPVGQILVPIKTKGMFGSFSHSVPSESFRDNN